MKKAFIIITLFTILLTACNTHKNVEPSEASTEFLTTYQDETLQTEENILKSFPLQEMPTTTSEVIQETTEPALDDDRDLYYCELVNQAINNGKKVVYLTFDDGSGTLTPSVLNILDEHNVKATFFVVGQYSISDDNARTVYNDIITRGHTLGIHSYTHDRANIYSSLEAFSQDCDKMYNYVIELTGYTPFLWRFPGGSATMFADSRMKTEYIPYVTNKGLIYYDWNVSSGDGSGNISANDIYTNVINGVNKNSISVVLLHDGYGHEETIIALPNILNTLINEMNCLVVPITESTPPIQSKF